MLGVVVFVSLVVGGLGFVLGLLVGRAMPAVEKRLAEADKTMLVIYAGLLARYGQMDLLSSS